MLGSTISSAAGSNGENRAASIGSLVKAPDFSPERVAALLQYAHSPFKLPVSDSTELRPMTGSSAQHGAPSKKNAQTVRLLPKLAGRASKEVGLSLTGRCIPRSAVKAGARAVYCRHHQAAPVLITRKACCSTHHGRADGHPQRTSMPALLAARTSQ